MQVACCATAPFTPQCLRLCPSGVTLLRLFVLLIHSFALNLRPRLLLRTRRHSFANPHSLNSTFELSPKSILSYYPLEVFHFDLIGYPLVRGPLLIVACAKGLTRQLVPSFTSSLGLSILSFLS